MVALFLVLGGQSIGGSFFCIPWIVPESRLQLSQKHLYIDKSQISIGQLLGEGDSGKVYKAKYQDLKVACKALKVSQSLKNWKEDQAFIDLLNEVRAMVTLGSHQNVVKFYGVVDGEGTKDRPMLVEEYVKGMSLRNVLMVSDPLRPTCRCTPSNALSLSLLEW